MGRRCSRYRRVYRSRQSGGRTAWSPPPRRARTPRRRIEAPDLICCPAGPQGLEPLPDKYTEIVPDLPPLSAELCNGMDDDGDMLLDEDCPDTDGDTVVDGLDNCRYTPNPDQADANGDYLGDVCDRPAVLYRVGERGWQFGFRSVERLTGKRRAASTSTASARPTRTWCAWAATRRLRRPSTLTSRPAPRPAPTGWPR